MSVHRFWSGTPRPDADWVRRVVTCTQSTRVIDWTPELLPGDARWVLDTPDAREQSNRFRYWVLEQFGGLWLDHDVIPLANLMRSPEPWTAALGGSREGCTMWFPRPHHPMLRALLAACRDDPAKLAGVGLLNQIGRLHRGVGKERRVLPFGNDGTPLGVPDPLAVHLWGTASTGVVIR